MIISLLTRKQRESVMAMGYLGSVLIFIILFQLLTVAQGQTYVAFEMQPFPVEYCISYRGNSTNNSTYQADLDVLLTSFSNTTPEFGFYNSSAGEVNAMGLCRGDLKLKDCRTCIGSSSRDIRRLCPNYKEAVIYQETCMLRYSDRSIFGTWETSPASTWVRLNYFADLNRTKPMVLNLLDKLYDEAASGVPQRKYAVGETVVGFENISALVQCTPDLQPKKCKDCLRYLHASVRDNSVNRNGLYLMGPSCNIRYDYFRFYRIASEGPPLSPSPSPTRRSTDTTGSGNRRSIAIISGSAVAFVVLAFCICICISLKVRKPKEQVEKVEEILTSIESLQFDFNSIKIATDNFSDANKLGQGGFGDVYKGRLPNGQEIAVKRLSKDSRQGEVEFKNEVSLVAKLQHRNLVRLIGFCLEGNEKVLIYELAPNANLDQFIFDPVKCSQLTWERRYRIIEGIARGLVYLHEDSRIQIIHRDLKASNILLDEKFNPKISDFGIARMLIAGQTQEKTTRIIGSYGYMAPEYAMSGKFSCKSDVYSFGVLTLEITSGRKNNYSQMEDLLNYAWKSWSEKTLANFIDPTLISSNLRSEVIRRCIQIALLCVQENVADRPTMASVVLMLCSHSLPLPIPSRPSLAFVSDRPIDQEPTNE